MAVITANQPNPKQTMSEKTVQVRSGGIGFGGLLALLFIGLKLGGVIDWSWWWVLSPLWIPLAIVLAVFVTVLTVGGIVMASIALFEHRTRKARVNIRGPIR